MSDFGPYLRKARQARRFTQLDLARRCEIDVSYVSKLENGRLPHTPSAKTLSALAEALEVDQLELFAQAGKLVGPLADISRQPEALTVMRVAVDRIDDAEGWDTLLRYIESDDFSRALAHPGAAERYR